MQLERWVGAAVLVALWLIFTLFNGFFAIDRILDRRRDGVSPMLIFGSLFGIAAILLIPVLPLGWRLLLLPLALAPDIVPFVEERIHNRRERDQ